MNINSIYTKNFKGRSIGLEYEFPIVKKDLTAPTYDEMKRIFDFLNGKKIYDGNNIVGVENHGIVTTDYGVCTLEVNFPPAKDLFEAKDIYDKIMEEVLYAVKSAGLKLMFYGIQPISRPDKRLIAPKKRYTTLTKRFGMPNVLYHTVNASAQVHIGLHKHEMVDAVNELNKVSPVLIDMNANSRVWWCNINEPRELFWDWVVNIPQDKGRKGIPLKFESLDDYLNKIFEFEPIMTKRGNTYGEFHGLSSFNEFLQNGGKIYDPESNELIKEIKPEEIDIYAHDSFIWWDARLKSAYGTIELRCCSQQTKERQMVVPALALGLIENLDELKKLEIKNPQQARIDACIYGGLDMYWQKVVDIASEGLVLRGKGEEDLISVNPWRKNK